VAAAGFLYARHRARAAWSDDLSAALDEVTWLGDDLLATLQRQPPEVRAAAWTLARPRVVALEGVLEGLVATSPDPAQARRIAVLSSTVLATRSMLDSPVSVRVGPSMTLLSQARRELAAAVAALRPSPEP